MYLAALQYKFARYTKLNWSGWAKMVKKRTTTATEILGRDLVKVNCGKYYFFIGDLFFDFLKNKNIYKSAEIRKITNRTSVRIPCQANPVKMGICFVQIHLSKLSPAPIKQSSRNVMPGVFIFKL
jgi:hypothetical protein